MAPKKLVIAAKTFRVPAGIQTTGMKALKTAKEAEYLTLRTTGSGRKVVLTFGREEGARGTTIYMDDIVTVVERRERREYFVASRTVKVVAKKAAAKKSVAKKLSGMKVGAKKTAVKFMSVEGAIRGDRFEAIAPSFVIERISASSATLKSEKPIIPASIKKFVLYFFDNIRKLVCPKKGAKPTLGTTTTATVNTIAIWIVGHFAVAGAVAGGLASAVLLLIVTATKGAFCNMSVDLAKELIKKA